MVMILWNRITTGAVQLEPQPCLDIWISRHGISVRQKIWLAEMSAEYVRPEKNQQECVDD